ncbi:hypothetical protein J4456_00965 [Candidatus Pacearchaeota archaeon]|nr:hypothetical protein [Candidatus Pacearchaeota archaeon]
MSIDRESLEISEKTLNALVLICSAHPHDTFYCNLRQQLHSYIKDSEARKYFHFNRFGCSTDIDEGVSMVVMYGGLVSCSQNLHRTTQMLYNQLEIIKKSSIYFPEEDKKIFSDIGRKLKIHEFYSKK